MADPGTNTKGSVGWTEEIDLRCGKSNFIAEQTKHFYAARLKRYKQISTGWFAVVSLQPQK